MTILSSCSSWVQHSEFRKIVAVVDMLLIKVPTHDFSNFGVATLNARYSQCGALSTMGYIWDLLGWTKEDFVQFIWHEGTANEMANIMEGEEELDNPDSYLPYCSALGLVSSCVYSASNNPYFTIFAHTIGSLLGNPRSQNAFYDPSKINTVVLDNAKVVAYVASKTANFNLQFTTDEITPEMKAIINSVEPMIMQEAEDELSNPEPRGSDLIQWLTYCKTYMGIGPKVQAWTRLAAARIQNPRKNSLGDYIKTNFA